MNTQLLIQLVQEKQQALRAERWGVKTKPHPSQTFWAHSLRNWLNHIKTQSHATALGQ